MLAYERRAGLVTAAQLLSFPPKHKRTRISPAQRAGLRYETSCNAMLFVELDGEVKLHPAIRFRNQERPFDQIAIPDAWVIHKDVLTLIEIKLRHTTEAWRQLNNFYAPIVRHMYPEYHVQVLEICKNYDPAVKLPGPIEIVKDLRTWTASRQATYGIYIWSGRG